MAATSLERLSPTSSITVAWQGLSKPQICCDANNFIPPGDTVGGLYAQHPSAQPQEIAVGPGLDPSLKEDAEGGLVEIWSVTARASIINIGSFLALNVQSLQVQKCSLALMKQCCMITSCG